MLPWSHTSPQPKRHLDRFSRFCRVHGRAFLYFTIGRPFLLEIAPSHGGSGSPSNTWFLGPTQVHSSESISIGSAVSSGLMDSARQTGHATPSVTVGCIYVRGTAMRPNKYNVCRVPYAKKERRRSYSISASLHFNVKLIEIAFYFSTWR